MEILYQVLNIIATSLLIPTIIVLLFLFIKTLLLIGSFFGNYADRAKYKKTIKPLLIDLEKNHTGISIQGNERYVLSKYLKKMQEENWQGLKAEKLLTDMQLEYKKQLESSKILMRSGPMLGLMGTLIPMGPALAGLAAGDISAMALNMQLAFSTTVLGIFIGLVSFIVMEIQKRWANEDHNDLDYLFEIIKKREK